MDESLNISFPDAQTFGRQWQQVLFMVDPEKDLPLPGVNV